MFRKTFFICILLLLCMTGFSQDLVIWSGGVGIGERESAPKTGTKLVFFSDSGRFLSNVDVTVKSMKGEELVSTITTGPWLILNLAPGQYLVRAEVANRDAQGGIITVDSTSQEFGFKFSQQ